MGQFSVSDNTFRSLVEAQDLTTAAGQATFTALMGVQEAFAQLTPAAETLAILTASKTSTDAAFSALKRSIDAQKTAIKSAADEQAKSYQTQIDAATTTVSAIKSVYDSLSSALDGLSVITYEQAKSTLAAALAHSNAGGSLVGFNGLDAAIRAISAQDENKYSSVAAMKQDAAVTQGLLLGLKANAGGQLSVADMTLSAVKTVAENVAQGFTDQITGLDSQLSIAQSQLDALRGIDNSILSLADALKGFNTSTVLEKSAASASTMANGASAGHVLQIEQMYQSILGRPAESAGLNYWAGLLASGVDATDIYSKIASSPEALSRIPKFASGGDHLGGLRLVGERGMEIEATGPSRIFNADQTRNILSGGGNNARLEKLVEGLTAEVQRLQAIVADGSYQNKRTADAVNGNPEQPMLVEVAA